MRRLSVIIRQIRHASKQAVLFVLCVSLSLITLTALSGIPAIRPGDDIAAIIIEPIQGEGGIVMPPAGYIRAAADLCRKHNVLFIADEIQTGFARTGKMFCSEYAGIEADLMTVAKGMANGFPIAAGVTRVVQGGLQRGTLG